MTRPRPEPSPQTQSRRPVLTRPDAKWKSNDFFTPPWWRWERAFALATSPDPGSIFGTDPTDASDGTDDPITRAAVASIHVLAGRSTRQPPPRKHALFDEARAIFLANGSTRWAIEAYTLTRLSQQAVADKLGLNVALVGAYEPLFFDVRARIHHRDWICKFCFGPGKGLTGFAPDDLGSLWRNVGYSGGVFALDPVRAVTTGSWPENGSPTLRRAVERFVAVAQLPSDCTLSELSQLLCVVQAGERGTSALDALLRPLAARARRNSQRLMDCPGFELSLDHAPSPRNRVRERHSSDGCGKSRAHESGSDRSAPNNETPSPLFPAPVLIDWSHEFLDREAPCNEQGLLDWEVTV